MLSELLTYSDCRSATDPSACGFGEYGNFVLRTCSYRINILQEFLRRLVSLSETLLYTPVTRIERVF